MLGARPSHAHGNPVHISVPLLWMRCGLHSCACWSLDRASKFATSFVFMMKVRHVVFATVWSSITSALMHVTRDSPSGN